MITITFVDALQIARREWGDKAVVWFTANYPGKYTGPRYFVGTKGIFGLRAKGQGKSWRQALKDAGIKLVSEEEALLYGDPLAQPPKGVLFNKAISDSEGNTDEFLHGKNPDLGSPEQL